MIHGKSVHDVTLEEVQQSPEGFDHWLKCGTHGKTEKCEDDNE